MVSRAHTIEERSVRAFLGLGLLHAVLHFDLSVATEPRGAVIGGRRSWVFRIVKRNDEASTYLKTVLV